MKVVLFKKKWYSPISWAISLITKSKFVHAGVIFPGHFNNIVVDSSESRGYVGTSKPIERWGKRKIMVFDVPDTDGKCFRKAINLMGVKYDYFGVAFWVLKLNEKKNLHCAEFVLKLLGALGLWPEGFDEKKVFAPQDVFNVLAANDIKCEYEGSAKHYVVRP